MARAVFVAAVAALLLAVAAADPTHSDDGGWISMGPNKKPHTADKRAHRNPPTRNAIVREPQPLRADQAAVKQAHAPAPPPASAPGAVALPDSEKQTGCPAADQCSFTDKFKKKDTVRWTFAHEYANGNPFDAWWSKKKVWFDLAKRKMKIGIARIPGHGKPYVAGQMQSKNWHGYGCYEVRMKPANQEGLISTFFSYTGPWDAAPGKPKAHNEVDIEFVYKKQYGKLMMQANYFTNGKGGNEKYIDLKFKPDKGFHNYGFKWTSKKISWFVDGKKVYAAKNNIPKISQGPHKIMMNFWPVSSIAAGWGGYYSWLGPKTTQYDGVRFTKGENCKIQNRF